MPATQWLRGRSIRAKLLGIVLLTTGFALVVSGALFTAIDATTYRQQAAADLETEAMILGKLSAAALTFDDPTAAGEYLAALDARPAVVEAATYDAEGEVFASYRRTGARQRAWPPVGPDGHHVDEDHLVVFRSIAQSGEHLGTFYMRARLGLRDRLVRYGAIVLGVSVGSLGIATLLLGRLQGVVSRPLLEVTAVARRVVDEQDYAHRVAKRSEDEIGVLVDAFNQMLARIQEREESLRAANEALQSEIAEHREARQEVTALAQTLERRVLERTAELEAANKELEAFSYSVSHDLRAPLRSIHGFTALLESRHAAKLDDEGRHYMSRIMAATQRMGQLIDDMLQLSRTVRAEMVRKDVDLSDVARQVAQDLRSSAVGRKVTFRIEPGMRVNADPTLIRVVMENLMSNAWKFTSKVGEPTIEIGTARVDGHEAYFVRDNGAGFDMKHAGKLFGAFQRLHAVSDFEGTGVGLANVQRIVRRHGGRIWAEAQVGRGATFHFTLAA